MELRLPWRGIHDQYLNICESLIGKPLRMAQRDLLLSLLYFLLALLFSLAAGAIGPTEDAQDMPKQNMHGLYQMDLHFAIGSVRHETKSQRRLRLKKKQEEKRKKELRQKSKGIGVPLPPVSTWRILPGHSALCIDMLHGTSFFTKLQSLHKIQETLETPHTCEFWPASAASERLHTNTLCFYKNVEGDLYQNQQVRWKLKKLLTQWRLYYLRQANDVDPITLNPIQHPVTLNLFQKRLRYQFEAQPFALHVHKKLLHNDGQIPNPVFPKNPLTNESFSVEQFASLHAQCKQYGYTFWTLEAFQAAKYCVVTFANHQQKLLRLHALRMTLNDSKDYECIDTVYDYIQSTHETFEKPFYTTVYKWALAHAFTHPIIQQWRRSCLKWYETDILTDDPALKRAEFVRIENKLEELCEAPTELKDLRKKFLERRRDEVTSSP
jgi:hypothetical protein